LIEHNTYPQYHTVCSVQSACKLR